ncbi:MAG TPA: PilZ domain-containing protein [Tepidisphaeraceae bacterium]|jgi:c-di-GMP-binding flagellar brake protein YcgR|nr:PilZ domain-containing protein [Tepidisphaeraceae bacterium]
MRRSQEGSERRRGLRIRQNRPVKVLDPVAAKYFGGQTQDISATGLRLELPAWTPLRMGQELSVHVGLSRNGQTLANRRQMLPARVVWINRRLTGGRVEAGVEFMSTIAAHLDAA